MKYFNSIDEMIGNTPLVKLNSEKWGLKANVFAKVEAVNPAGSVKDRIARQMLDDAQESGKLTKDSVIIEPTSGNTGIALACLAAARGYRIIIVMPETMSIERRKLIKGWGAELVLTPGKDGMKGAIARAEELTKEIPNAFLAGQFVNPSNPKAHYKTTGPEIFDALDGKVDAFVAGIGTGGTVSGVGKYLKEKKADVKIIGVEPATSAVLTTGKAGPHKIQGIGAGFVPDTLDRAVLDKVVPVSDSDAIETARLVAKNDGISVGISSGAAAFAAIEEARNPKNEGRNIVVLFPDNGFKYLSTALFEEEN